MIDGTLLITVDDKTIGIRFGMQSIMAISQEGILETDVTGVSEKAFLTTSTITKMAYHGYLNWCLWCDVQPEFDKKKFIDFLDDAFVDDMGIFGQIIKAFEESKALKKMKDGQKKMTNMTPAKTKRK